MTDISFNNWSAMSDIALMETIGKFVQHHRLKQNKSQDEVAQAAGISRSTLSLLERGQKINLGSLIQVLRVLDLLFVMDAFSISESISPIAYAKLKKNKKQRARSNTTTQNPESAW